MVAPKATHKPMDAVVVPAEIGLTSKQEKFCQLYASDDSMTQTECARTAGYSDQYAAVQATKMLKHPKIIERIRDIKTDLGRKYSVTFETHVKKLAEIRDAAFGCDGWVAWYPNGEGVVFAWLCEFCLVTSPVVIIAIPFNAVQNIVIGTVNG